MAHLHGTTDVVTTGHHSTNPPSNVTTFTLRDSLVAVQTITVWIDKGSTGYTDRDLVKAIQIDWTDGTGRSQGNKTGNSHSFDFNDGEKVTSLSLWTGDRVDRILLKTDKPRTFDQGGKDYTGGKGGTEHPQELGTGILLGFAGSSDSDELVSLGAIFKESSD
jgi:hypothetical protein